MEVLPANTYIWKFNIIGWILYVTKSCSGPGWRSYNPVPNIIIRRWTFNSKGINQGQRWLQNWCLTIWFSSIVITLILLVAHMTQKKVVWTVDVPVARQCTSRCVIAAFKNSFWAILDLGAQRSIDKIEGSINLLRSYQMIVSRLCWKFSAS